MQTLGNIELLQRGTVGFFCSREVSSAAILRCYDWATSLDNKVVMSGFQSSVERDVLSLLLQNETPAIIVLARRLYREIPPDWQPALDAGRLLIVSVAPNAPRISQATATLRNQYIAATAHHLVFGHLHPTSTLQSLYQTHQPKSTLLIVSSPPPRY